MCEVSNQNQRKNYGLGQKSKAKSQPTGTIRPVLFYAMFGALAATNILTLVAFLMSPDIALLVDGQSERTFAAYEDRITRLRMEIDRLHSRQYAQEGNLNIQLQELSQQQQILTEQHAYVKALAVRAEELGIDTASLIAGDDDAIITGSIDPDVSPYDMEAVTRNVYRMMTESRMALAALSEAANSSTDLIVENLGALGISPQLPETTGNAVGGPYLPVASSIEPSSLLNDANAVLAAFERFRAARIAADNAPIHQPVTGEKVRVSSNFGNRRDPFLKRLAFHAGMDFPAPRGTTVVSAGAGKVAFSGRRSGYGNVVEIEHADGFLTRYAHLSKRLVIEGDEIEVGSVIGEVGSTGRSTGPHLHFEVRKNNTPLNPSGFLKAGKQLSRLY